MSVPHPFTLRQLQYAVAVGELLSFRKAAERCHVSQPSLSAQLAQLEEALGVRLFERDRRRVLPTRAGEALLARARQLLVQADDLVTASKSAGDPLAGMLRVGVIPTISPYLLPLVAPALRASFPRLRVTWIEDKTRVLVERLDTGTLDAALLALEAEIGDFEHEVVARDAFVLATPVGHPLGASSSPARPSELRGTSVLLLNEGHCFREQALSFCNRARARELEFRATSLATLVQMVAGGAGVTLLPTVALPTVGRRGDLRLRPFVAPAPHRTIALIWRKRSPLGPPLRQVAAAMRSAYPAPRPTGTARAARSTTTRTKKPKRA